jgi:hypothetical protein
MPQVIHGLSIKGDTWTNDWLYQDLLFEVEGNDSGEVHETLCAAEEKGTSFKLDLNCGSRDGCFESDQLFMVYERSDVEALISALTVCIVPTE